MLAVAEAAATEVQPQMEMRKLLKEAKVPSGKVSYLLEKFDAEGIFTCEMVEELHVQGCLADAIGVGYGSLIGKVLQTEKGRIKSEEKDMQQTAQQKSKEVVATLAEQEQHEDKHEVHVQKERTDPQQAASEEAGRCLGVHGERVLRPR